ncbi:MAG: TRAP transporter permease [Burkholderiales bacterium]|jgi:TRAP transporter 4TM/12TM fusion protein|nr:TRAP transporter permease [Burkholderiales bacterium]
MSTAHAAEETVKPLIPDEEFSGNRRLLHRWETLLLAVLCVGFTVFHLYVLNVYSLEPLLFRAIHVGWGTALGLIIYAPFRKAGRVGVPWYDWLLVLASIACAVYVVVELDGLLFRAGAQFTTGDVISGFIGTLLVLEFTRRTSGLALPIVAGIFIIYCFVGPWMPGVLEHKGFAIDRFFTYIYSEYGIFGVTTQVSSSYIILFVTFAAFLHVSRVGDYINDLCNAMFGWARGGPAKAAVASGIMFGSISGSAVANVVASGMVTIPMMRKVGYDRQTAAAIEATSSTGGQITPPVLGAGAFLMAEITGIPYGQIALAAVIPALLFYIACWIHVDLHAIRLGLKGVSRSELPPLKLMLTRLYLFSPLIVFVWALLEGYSPFRAGGLGIMAALIAGWLSRLFDDIKSADGVEDVRTATAVFTALLLRFGALAAGGILLVIGFQYGVPLVRQLGNFAVWSLVLVLVLFPAALFGWKRTLEALSLAARDTVQLVAVCACAGIIVGVIALTGIGGRFSELILGIAGASQLVAMLFAAMVALILGMGMPTTAAYAIAAAVIAPGLTKIGIPALVAHMFIFYFAVISAITPPVALASFAAAGMCNADPWKTSWIALKMGLATFIIPFMFFYAPVLLMQGEWTAIAQAFVSASIGVWFLAGSTEGWFGGKLAMPLRIVMFGAALCLIHPGTITDLIGLAIGVPIYLWQRLQLRRAAA